MDQEQLRRAALVVSTLDMQAADKLLDQLDAEQAAIIRQYMTELGEVDPRAEREALDAFFRAGAPQPVVMTPPARTAATSPPFRFLHEATVDKLLPLILNEHPQTIALVLSHLPPKRAAEMLARLSSDLQCEVVRRLADIDQTDETILREIEEVLQLRIVECIETESRQQAGVQFLTSVLAVADSDSKRAILANLAEQDRELAGRLSNHRWTFDDVLRLPTRELAIVLDAAGFEIALLAVAGATPAATQRLLSAMPTDAQQRLRHALDTLGPTRLTDLEQAQHVLATMAEELASAGRIDVPGRVTSTLSLAA